MILNLVNEQDSEISYKVQRMPDGQNNVVLNEHLQSFIFKDEAITIKSRLNNFIDLEIIIATTASLKELGVKTIHLYVPYFLGARSDRKFEDGGNNYLKTVICPIINAQGYESVTVLDPHSHSLESCLNNFKKIDNSELVKWAIQDIWDSGVKSGRITVDRIKNQMVLVAPDAGAEHKIFQLTQKIGFKGEVITCSKGRDGSGEIIKTNIPVHSGDRHTDYIIVDDICDGGKTFTEIAKAIKLDPFSGGKLYLVVTHGIFSKGFKELGQYFEAIYCTNSYRHISDIEYGETTKVKQLNVF